jgi:tetratricopeptide (TPR) repeat protein
MTRKPSRSRQRNDEAALERAQELIYDAWDAPTAKRRAALARKALEVSPLCADAHVILAGAAKQGSAEELEHWQRGVEAGKAALGPAFEELTGEFWGWLESRPYMRARLGLAMALWRRDARDEAAAHLREMLRLNPNDNQGVRYLLAAWLVELECEAELAGLLKRYGEDGSASWTYTAALLAFRREGDTGKSRKLLDTAFASNDIAPMYLFGDFKMPRRLPEAIGIGDEREAVYFMDTFGKGWCDTPGALEWMKARFPQRRR